ncbi:S8 family peptidase [Hyphococcus luteus]|uniref:Peptidase S8/S53 domain-containing protein n=1 Tax=Hyphococcus luteus TaxID=2058213 RepID=A0A2S7K7U5_9PROT|nr:S8 family peptidase [Marinicaulis flavus]PQA88566.1 hypothetical protein CW354_09800 [Marinicaulis flavus]
MYRVTPLFFRAFSLVLAALSGAALSACSSGGNSDSSPMQPPAASTPPTPTTTTENFITAEYRRQAALEQINVIPAYEEGTLGNGAIVSIIDTGIDTDHPEFAGRIHPQSADLVIAGVVSPGDERPGGPDLNDDDDHGTPVASIIGAAKNDVGAHGVAPEATLLVFRVDDEGDDELSLLGAAISEAVDRTVNIGADVVNMSFGSNETSARDDFRNIVAFLKDNDVVTVLAAGNDGDADPDDSALGAFDVSGAPAAIIAGSVDSSNVISDFSNRAGEGADIYLVAPGELLSGVYPGAAADEVRVFSGTSASTPVISGAVALIRALWPNLTAEEAVDILLTSATDLGAPGTDPVYGRGLLNVGAAVSPMGGVSTSSITGSEVDPAALGATLSGAYGSSFSGLGDIVVLDSYNRDFRLSLDGLVSRSGPARFDLEGRYSPFNDHRYSSMALGDGWSMRMRLTARDRSASSLLNNQMAFAKGADPNADMYDRTLGFAVSGEIAGARLFTAQGFSAAAVDRMSNPTHATPFLSDSAFSDAFLPRGTDAVTALTRFQATKKISIDVLMTRGQDRDSQAERLRLAQGLPLDKPDIFVLRSGVNLALGRGVLRFEQGLRREKGAVFNARFGDGDGAATAYAAIEGAWPLSALWRLQGRFAAGLTFADAYGFDAFAADAPTLKTTQFSAAVSRAKLFSDADALWLGVSQPLQIEAGAIELMLPTGFDQKTETLIFTPVSASLAPQGRRLDFEAGYRLIAGPLGAVDINVLHQTFGGYGLSPETTALIRSRFDF